jgi:hypothetical protein
MHFDSLLAANLRPTERPAKADPEAEDRFYRDNAGPSLPSAEALVGLPAAAASWLLGHLPRRLRTLGR